MDNTQLNVNTTLGDIINTEDNGGVKTEVVKVAFGGSGTVTKVDTAHQLPVTDAAVESSLASIDGKLTNPLPVSGTVSVSNFPAGGGAATIADGADITQGAIADAIVAAGASGTLSAKLRRITQGIEDLKTLIVLAAGTAIIGKVGIDQTTPGTTNKVNIGTDGTVTINALPAGGNVIGHVIADSGSTTAVTGTVATLEVAPTTILNGKTTVTTAGTRVVLAASATVKSVTIKAAIANSGIIYVGNSTVSASNGFELSAGDTVSLDIANLNTISIDSSTNSQSVTYIGIN